MWERRSLPGLIFSPVRGAGKRRPVASNRDGPFLFLRRVILARREKRLKAKRKYTAVIERDEEGYYIASVPALRGCHTQARTMDTLMKRVREVIELCIENGDALDDSLEFVGIQQISL